MGNPACDLCHRSKEKCLYDDDKRSTCARCARLGKPCRPRQRKRMGRRPVAKAFDQGTYHIMSLGPSSHETETRPNPHPKSKSKPKPLMTTGHRSDPQEDDDARIMTVSPLTVSISPRGASQYYRVHCMLEHGTGFLRAHRYFLIANSMADGYRQTIRFLFHQSPQMIGDGYEAVLDLMMYARRAQRRRRNPRKAPLDQSLHHHHHHHQPLLQQQQPPPDLSVGSASLQAYRRASSAIARPEDAAVVAMLAQVLCVYNHLVPRPFSSSSYSSASSFSYSSSSSSSSSSSHSPDYSPSWSGAGAAGAGASHIIAQHTLLAIRDPWLPLLLADPRYDAVTLTPLVINTVESLVRREVPVVRLEMPPGRRWVHGGGGGGGSRPEQEEGRGDGCPDPSQPPMLLDRMFGVLPSLLPLLYDLCVCSHREKVRRRRRRQYLGGGGSAAACDEAPEEGEEQGEGEDPYSTVEREIAAWSPPVPPSHMLTASEVESIQTQARVYRDAALLMVHRLRYPLPGHYHEVSSSSSAPVPPGSAGEGNGDYSTTDPEAQASRLASSILSDLWALARSWNHEDASSSCSSSSADPSSSSPAGLGAGFPLLALALERPDDAEAVADSMAAFRLQEEHCAGILRFARYAREEAGRRCRERETGEGGGKGKGNDVLWFDVLGDRVDGVLL